MSIYGVLSSVGCHERICALARANRVFGTDKKTSVQKTRLWIKARAVWGGFYTRSPIAHGCAFHPCAIGDPRGRLFVRAISQLRYGARFKSPGIGKNNSMLANVSLEDKYRLDRGRVFLTGVQALARLPMLQHQRDVAAGLNTAGYVSGYRGSPLAGLDTALRDAERFLRAHNITSHP